MTGDFFKSFEAAPYPCYWLDNSGVLWRNTAAETADNAPSDRESIHAILERASRKMQQEGQAEAHTIPFLAEALHLKGITLLPLQGGFFAAINDAKEPPIASFSTLLREPLTTIFAVLPILTKSLEGTELRYVEEIQQSCYALLRLTTNMESASRLDRFSVDLKPLDLTALVDSICFCAESICRDPQIPIQHDLPDYPLPVLGDMRLLGEVLLNLLRNSLQYTRDGNRILVRLYQTADRAVLVVDDRGLGIKPEVIEHIFNPYFSVDPYNDGSPPPGMGLGLSIAREALRAMGGTITAESRFGEGTRITASLPLDHGNAEVLGSDSADYLLNRFSPIYVQLSGYCRLPDM